MQAVDSQIIKAGMNNEAQAQAINTWIMAHGVYDDGVGNATRYFGMTDNSVRADRTQYSSFMVDAYISRYAN